MPRRDKSMLNKIFKRTFLKDEVGSIDVDPQNGFTPVCPKELPVEGGHEIAQELNRNKALAKYQAVSQDSHPYQGAKWEATPDKPIFSVIEGEKNLDIRWPLHCVPGTKGFELIKGLPHVSKYDFIVYKGVANDMHPYGACYHDLGDKISTGLIEFFKDRQVKLVIVGGLALDYCVKVTALQLKKAGFEVVVNLAACRGIDTVSTQAAISQMKKNGIMIMDDSRQIKKIIR